MEVHFYKTGCADAARISFKDCDQKSYHVWIDAGFERTFRQTLFDEISKIVDSKENINLWLISHIHDDHIGGALTYVDAINANILPDIVERWFYNAPRVSDFKTFSPHSSASFPASIRQGDRLTNYLLNNRNWNAGTIFTEADVFDIGGLKITILSPGTKQLNRLYDKYKSNSTPLENSEQDQISEAKGAGIRDYHLKVEELTCTPFSEDKNIENGSSISILTDYHDFKILWLADAHPSTIIESLKRLGFTTENPLECNWVKVAHHGSAGNNSIELYSLIKCNNYVISVNGDNTHGLPNKAALVNILKSRRNQEEEQYHFHFTHDDSILRSIFMADGSSIFDDLNFRVHYLDDEKSLKVIWSKAPVE